MKYSYHIARAIIENNSIKISDEDVVMLLSPNPKAKSFIVDTFYGYYYTKPILEFFQIRGHSNPGTQYSFDISACPQAETGMIDKFFLSNPLRSNYFWREEKPKKSSFS